MIMYVVAFWQNKSFDMILRSRYLVWVFLKYTRSLNSKVSVASNPVAVCAAY
jgi:hypothetical protein